MLRTEISRKDLDNVLGKLDTLSKDMRKNVEFTINKHALRIESDAKSRVVVDNGRLRSSIKTEKLGELGRTVYTNVEYAPYVEFGTKSQVQTTIMGEDYSKIAMQFRGGKGSSADFKTTLKSWAKRKGIPDNAVYPIMMSILNKGVKARPFLFPAYETERPRIIKALKDLVKNGGRL